MAVYTRTGDMGETDLLGADRAAKDPDLRQGTDKCGMNTRIKVAAVHPKSLEDELHGVGGDSSQIVAEWLVPEKYARQETTPLTAEVKPGPNTINFDLPVPH